MLTQLKELYLFDNNLTSIPPQFGTLHQLQTLGVEGNPLDPNLKTIVQKDGTPTLISYLRDNCPVDDEPPERQWKYLISPQEQELLAQDPNVETFSVMCFNILCEKYATERLYGYTPSWALAWSYRKGRIMEEILKYDNDFLCLQEVDITQYEEFFCVNLSKHGYEGVFWPKSRYKTMNDTDRRQVDGCATFYKADKYKLVEKRLLEFSAAAMQRQDFKKTDDMFNRVLGKDHIAVICLLENIHTGTRFVIANAHIHWDPLYVDVKVVQTALLIEEIEKVANLFAKYPPPPMLNGVSTPKPESSDDASDGSNSDGAEGSRPAQQVSQPHRPPPTYSDGTKIPLLICGDFNSVPDSGVYDLLSNGHLPPNHPDFKSHTYGRYTSEGIRHRLGLKSSYAGLNPDELPLTNYTPSYQGFIDYVWYSAANLGVNKVLGEVDRSYLEKVVGFPNAHFPSDHVSIASEFRVKPPRDHAPSRQPSYHA